MPVPRILLPGRRAFAGRCAAAAVLSSLLLSCPGSAAQTAADPFSFFRPSVIVTADERDRLERGQAIARILSARAHQVAVFAAVPAHVDRARLLAWMRKIEQLKKSAYVLAIGRFSDPPRLDDLDSLTLDDEDLDSIPGCRPGDCGLKLTAAEILALQAVKPGQPNWRTAVQQEFRRLLLARIEDYRSSGFRERARETASSLLDQAPFLAARLPAFTRYLDQYPAPPPPGVESFIYWAKEQLGGKPVISATHVSMTYGASDQGEPEMLVAGQQIFAIHYMNGSLALTVLLRGTAGSPNSLVYVNRSDVDVVGGLLGGLVRPFLERRVKGDASAVLQGLRRRLEGGEPSN
jgi:hypothetical protein